MERFVLYGMMILFTACNSEQNNNKKIPLSLQVINYDTALKKINETWWYKGELFSGTMIQQEKDHRIVYQLPIKAGKENGLAMGWYNTGEKLMERNFVDGKMQGIFKQWWPNGRYRYLFNYKDDQYEGKQLVFFPDGKKRQESNYIAGQEEGLQSTWNEAGQLISNYTIRNKKLYGVIAIKSCIPAAHE
jgi:antitoxin component YwqK of YwqJK toxin-antitoxin module